MGYIFKRASSPPPFFRLSTRAHAYTQAGKQKNHSFFGIESERPWSVVTYSNYFILFISPFVIFFFSSLQVVHREALGKQQILSDMRGSGSQNEAFDQYSTR